MPPGKKPTVDQPPLSAPAPITGERAELGPRKLIRSSLSEVRRDPSGVRGQLSRKPVPPEQTNAEAFYYLKQMQSRTPIVVLLTDGEELRGWIEWYDKDVIKLNRDNAPNLLVQKHAIKYLYKEEEERQFRRRRSRAAREDGPARSGPGDGQPDGL
ncbi:MAG: RNA chaperone Hfq [Acidobacteria bacterium]|nr:RNA chaperone Hfq [Acidobacteriota bacterium]MCG3191424.1 RNA-binding protein Hfq [Thermoanaerobaculia bacterium]MCK6681502.1 RNA chaperone Hfq [Thermoanaerobaculia bacterium]